MLPMIDRGRDTGNWVLCQKLEVHLEQEIAWNESYGYNSDFGYPRQKRDFVLLFRIGLVLKTIFSTPIRINRFQGIPVVLTIQGMKQT